MDTKTASEYFTTDKNNSMTISTYHKCLTHNNILYYHTRLASSTAASKKSSKVGTINFLTSLQPSTGNALHMSAPCLPTRPQIFSVFVFL
jgi:hypothetical protein